MQDYTLKAEPALFVWGFDCTATCDPDNRNPVALPHSRPRLGVRQVPPHHRRHDGHRNERARPRAVDPTTTWGRDSSAYLTLEDARYNAQPPASKYFVAIGAGLTSVDGQTLGYTWAGQVENWHRTAFTSFGDGHGVWEASGGSVLPFYSRNLFDVKQWAVAPQARRSDADDSRADADVWHQAAGRSASSRKLGVTNDRIQSHGLDVAKALGPRRDRSRLGGGRERRVDSQREALGAARCARRSCR